MATKKRTKRAAGAARVVEKKPVEVAAPSLVESSTVESLVQVLSPEEIEKSKTLVFGWLTSAAAKNNAQARFFGTLAVLSDIAVKVLSENLDVVKGIFRYKTRKMGDDMRSKHFSEVAASQPPQPKAPQAVQGPPPRTPQQVQAGYRGRHPRTSGQPGQRPLPPSQRPLTQSMAEKLQAAGHMPPAEQIPAPAEQQPQQTQ
jgi:hypothetical protein